MLHIKVNATSANICIGFDTLGLALSLANEFTFEKSDKFEFEGFASEYRTEKTNLVCEAYKKVFGILNKNIIPCKIGYKGQIPVSRGLGSSSSLIVAGVFAANYFLNSPLSINELFDICVSLEGHPDNVAPAIYGGLVSSYKKGNSFIANSFNVNKDLVFIVAIPKYELKTKDAREALPKSLSYADAVNNISRIINLPRAFNDGDINLLLDLFVDRLHEPYRGPLIKEYNEIKSICSSYNIPMAISGSGSTMLIISKSKDIISKIDHLDVDIKALNIGDGVKLWED